ncbi:MAG: phage tail protein, partial [Clostridiales bacterium]|nr:phage tail protein [Clostridiales bacterium]
MIPILYEANETAFVSNGICRLQDCISCKATEERNGIYEVEFEYPVDGMNFDKIQLGRIIAVTHDDAGDVQPFDIVSCSRPINGVVTFRGVHISYRLNKIATTLRLSGRLDGIMSMLTSQNWGFGFLTDIPSSGNAVVVESGYPVQVRRYLGGMEGSILDNYGGEYEFDRFNVILHQARGEKKDFAIRYGLNLVDYEEDIDYGDTYTKCMPY